MLTNINRQFLILPPPVPYSTIKHGQPSFFQPKTGQLTISNEFQLKIMMKRQATIVRMNERKAKELEASRL